MKNKNYSWFQAFKTKMLVLFLFAGFLAFNNAGAQTTITTTYANNNGSSVVVFSFINNNSSGVIINSIGSLSGATATYTCYLYAKAATYGVAPGTVGTVTAANGWTVIGSNTNLPLTANTTGSGSAATTFISGMNYLVPAFTQVRLCLQLSTGAGLAAFNTTAGNLRYSTVTTPCSASGGGVDLQSCASYGYGGTMTSATNTPRALIGFVTFSSALPCSGTPTPGNTISSANPVCSGALFTLSLQNPTSGTGVTYQWQSADDAAFTVNAANLGTASTQATSQTAAKYYRCQVTCSAGPSTGTSTPLLVTLNSDACSCLNYCASTHANGCSLGDEITNVTIPTTTLNNPSGCSGTAYTFFTGGGSQTGNLIVGNPYTLSCSFGTDGNQYFGAWIDYNNDGTFATTEFLGASGNAGVSGTTSINFTVPPGTSAGTHRLRVIGGNDAAVTNAQACAASSSAYGETEDYCLTLIAPLPCAGSPTPGTISLASTTTCGGATYNASGYDISLNITYQWESSTDNVNFFPISGATGFSYSTPGTPVTIYYRFAVTCTNSSTTAYSNTLTNAAGSTPAAPVTTGATRCGVGTVNLSAAGPGTINWFQSSSVGGPIINTGTTYNPSISSTTNYYVFSDPNSVLQTVGPLVTLAGTTAYASATTNYQTFDVLSNNGVIINAVDFRANAATPINTPLTIQLENSSGTPLGTATTLVSSPGNIQSITLNFFVPKGTGYHLRPIQNPNLQYHQSGFTNPYTIPNQISITGWDGGNTLFVFFYNWTVSTGCFSPVSNVTATVNTPPTLTITPSGSTSYCGSGSVGLTASGTGYVNFNWSPSVGLSATTGATVTASPSVTTTYTVLADDGGGSSGCASSQTVTITVNGPPSSAVTATNSTVCLGGTSNLSANGASSSVKQVGLTENPANNTIAVYDSWNTNVRTQILYTVAELNAAGLYGPTNISSIAFKVANKLSTGQLNGFTISMAQVATAPPLTTTYVVTPLTTVFTGSYATVLGWNTHNFPIPFVWNGTSNILVEICNGTPTVQGFDQIFNSPTASFQTIQANLLNCTSTTGNAILNRPITRFTGGAVNYSWSPGTNLSASNIETPVFTGNSLGSFPYSVLVTDPANGCTATSGITLNVVPPPSGGTVSGPSTSCGGVAMSAISESGGAGNYQWQVNINSGGFNDVSGATSASLIYTPGSGGTYVFRNRRNAGGCADAFSTNSLSVTVGPIISATASSTPTGICAGLTTQLNVNAIPDITPASGYCTSALYITTGCTDATPDEINDFIISNLSHLNTGCSGGTSGYGDFTSSQPVIQLLQNTNYPWTINCPFSSTEYVGFWIDMNNNGSFGDAGEFFLGTGPSVASAITGTLNVGSAAAGVYRMRVRLVYNTAQSLTTSCTQYTYGEAHDYKVMIGNGGWSFNYSWSPSSGLTPSSNVSNPTTPTLSSSTPYTVIVTEPTSGCSVSANVTVTVNPSPDPVANSNAPICEGNPLGLSSNNNASGQTLGNSYSWSGPSFTSSVQNPSVSGTATPSQSGTYTVTITNSFGCTASASTLVAVNANPTGTAAVTGVSCVGLCDGGVVITPTAGQSPYIFTDGVTVNTNGIFTNAFCEGPASVDVFDDNGCTATIPFSVGHISSAPVVINVAFPTVPAYACNGNSFTVSTNLVNLATTYTWDGPAGTTFNAGGNPYSSGSTTVTANFGPPNGSGYNICVQAGNGCGSTNRRCSFVRGTVNVPGVITPANNRTVECASTSANYSITSVTGATSYTWSITGNATVIGSGASATVNFGAGWAGGNLCVTANTPCFSSAPRCLALSNVTAAPGAISGSSTACPGSSVTYSIPVASGAATYNWILPANTTGSSSSNSILVNFLPGFTLGDIKVSITSICGVTSAQLAKTVASGLPAMPASVSGSLNGLCGQTVTYSCPSVAGATSYTWTTPGTINSGQGSTSVNVTYGSFSSGTVCVKANNACGSGAQRCVPVQGSPVAPGTITYSPNPICANASGVDIQVAPVFGTTSYSWSFPSGVTIVNNLGNEQIVNWGPTGGVVTVTVNNACGNASKNQTISLGCREVAPQEIEVSNEVTVYPNPAHDRITVQFNATEKTGYVLNLMDLSGRVISTSNATAQKGINTNEMDLSTLAKGVYMIELKSDLLNKQVRIVIE